MRGTNRDEKTSHFTLSHFPLSLSLFSVSLPLSLSHSVVALLFTAFREELHSSSCRAPEVSAFLSLPSSLFLPLLLSSPRPHPLSLPLLLPPPPPSLAAAPRRWHRPLPSFPSPPRRAALCGAACVPLTWPPRPRLLRASRASWPPAQCARAAAAGRRRATARAQR